MMDLDMMDSQVGDDGYEEDEEGTFMLWQRLDEMREQFEEDELDLEAATATALIVYGLEEVRQLRAEIGNLSFEA